MCEAASERREPANRRRITPREIPDESTIDGPPAAGQITATHERCDPTTAKNNSSRIEEGGARTIGSAPASEGDPEAEWAFTWNQRCRPQDERNGAGHLPALRKTPNVAF